MSTEGIEYAERLRSHSGVWWKRLLNVQAPYRWRVRRYDLGRTLEVGCGIGRVLAGLPVGSLGVDHNPHSIQTCRALGLDAMTTEEFLGSERAREGEFDSILLAHVLEHMTTEEGREVVGSYLPFLKPGGKVLFICPQEKGYATDATHVQFYDGPDLVRFAHSVGLQATAWESFPFPRRVGLHFPYNELHVLATKSSVVD